VRDELHERLASTIVLVCQVPFAGKRKRYENVAMMSLDSLMANGISEQRESDDWIDIDLLLPTVSLASVSAAGSGS
jgi:hypothetical protein